MAWFKCLTVPLPSRFKQNTSLLAAVRWWRSKTARHRGESPLLDIRLNENKPHLPEVYVDMTWSIGSHGREEILALQIVCDLVQLFAVSCEEDAA